MAAWLLLLCETQNVKNNNFLFHQNDVISGNIVLHSKLTMAQPRPVDK